MMRELREVLHESFGAHSEALEATDVSTELAGRAIASARRRRAWRAAATGGVSVAAVSAVAMAAMAFPGEPGADESGASDAWSWSLAPGAPAWCDLSTYPLANPEAWGPARYEGRLYVNVQNGEHVYVGLDGSHTVMEESSDGLMVATVDGEKIYAAGLDGEGGADLEERGVRLKAMDFWGSGGGGGTYIREGDDPGLAYEWTTVAQQPVPSEIDVTLLAEVHTNSIEFGGTGLEPEVAGAGAVVETVARYVDGTEDVTRIGRGEPGAHVKDYTGLVSVSTRVTLPSGEVYELTSTYDASMTYAAACLGQGEPSASDAPTVTEGTDNGTEPFNYGPYLTGPESALFQCGAPLPEGMEAEDAEIEWLTGLQYDPEVGIEVDFGDGGFALHTVDPLFIEPAAATTPYPGWRTTADSEGIDDTMMGAVTYDALVWVDGENLIVARQVLEDPSLKGPRLEDSHGTGLIAYETPSETTQGRIWWTGPIDGTAVACEGASQDAVDVASVVIIHGYGQDGTAMTWQVIRP